MIIPVILAGGSGTRLWPLSRELYPKQLLPLVDKYTLLQNTVSRLSGVAEIGDPIVVCNENHRFLIAEQLRAIEVKPSAIILEPVEKHGARHSRRRLERPFEWRRSRAPRSSGGPPHRGRRSFCSAIEVGAKLAAERRLVTFGIVPDAPETGYGYIKKGGLAKSSNGDVQAMRISRFVEKPDRETAEYYVGSGEYLWNSGMFMFLASSVLEEIARFSPEISEACKKAVEKGTLDLDFFRLEAEAFKSSPSDSIDYAVMEKTDNGVIIPLSVGWNDLGSWDSLWDVHEKDADENVTIGDIITHDVKRSYINATSRLVAAIGIENHIVVETPDAVFISPWERAQEVKQLVQKMKSENRGEATTHLKVYRPWGSYESLSFDNRFQVKRIIVKPGAKLSLQRHHHRAEHWVVVRGTAAVTVGEKEFLLSENESTYIPVGTRHRLENPGKIPLELIEVQSGSYLGEDDIIRYDDVYGRKES